MSKKKGAAAPTRRLRPLGKKEDIISVISQDVVEVPELTEKVMNKVSITVTQQGEKTSKKGSKQINNMHSFYEATPRAVDTKMLSDFICAKLIQHSMLNKATGKAFDRTLPIHVAIRIDTIVGEVVSEAGLEFSTTPTRMVKIFKEDAPLYLREAFNPTTFSLGVTLSDVENWMKERKVLIAPEIKENKALAAPAQEVVQDDTIPAEEQVG